MARQHLEQAELGIVWRLTDSDEVVGRSASARKVPPEYPSDVVIDGRSVTRDQFGEALRL